MLIGKKTLEVCLYDAKRKLLAIHDIVEFENDDCEVIPCEIVSLKTYDSFASLLAAGDNCKKAGFANPEEALAALYTYYTPEQEKEYGVVGIEVKPV